MPRRSAEEERRLKKAQRARRRAEAAEAALTDAERRERLEREARDAAERARASQGMRMLRASQGVRAANDEAAPLPAAVAAPPAADAAARAQAAEARDNDPAGGVARASQGMARTRRREVAEAPSGDTPEAARRRSAAAVSPLSAALLRELREARMSRDAERERHDSERERHDALMADVVRNLFGALTPRGTHTHMRRYYACAGTDLPISNEQVMTATPCSRRRPAPPRPIPFHCLASRPRIRSRAPPSLRLGELPFSPFRSQGTPPSLIPTPAGRSLQRANLWF